MNLLSSGHARLALEKGTNASTVSVPHVYSKGSRVIALTGLDKRRTRPTGMVQAAEMVNRALQKRPLPSSIRLIHRWVCPHIRLRLGWHLHCSLRMCMDRHRTTYLRHSIPYIVPARARRRVIRARRIIRLSILRLTFHNPIYLLSGMTHPLYRRVPRVVPRKEDPGGTIFYRLFL